MAETVKIRALWIVIGTIVGVLVIAGGAVSWVARGVSESLDYHGYIDLSEVVDTPDLGSQGVTVLHGYTNQSKSLCAGVPGCEQGYLSHQAEFRKFDSPEHAHAFAASRSDTYQSHWIAIRFTDPGLDAHNRHWIQNFFDNVAGTSNSD